jgi:hypothetical protein
MRRVDHLPAAEGMPSTVDRPIRTFPYGFVIQRLPHHGKKPLKIEAGDMSTA